MLPNKVCLNRCVYNSQYGYNFTIAIWNHLMAGTLPPPTGSPSNVGGSNSATSSNNLPPMAGLQLTPLPLWFPLYDAEGDPYDGWTYVPTNGEEEGHWEGYFTGNRLSHKSTTIQLIVKGLHVSPVMHQISISHYQHQVDLLIQPPGKQCLN